MSGSGWTINSLARWKAFMERKPLVLQLKNLEIRKEKLLLRAEKKSGIPVGKVWLQETLEENDSDLDKAIEAQHFWKEFLNELKLDDLEQPVPSPARLGYLSFMTPAPGGSSWLTVYRILKRGEVGVTLSSHRDTAGDYASQAIVDDWECGQRLNWEEPSSWCRKMDWTLIRDAYTVGALDQIEVREKAFEWLSERVNTFVNTLRPRVRSAVANFR